MTKFSLLEGLNEADTRAVLMAARRRKFKRGEAICHEGDPGDTATMRVMGPGSQFGEIAVIDQTPRSATIVALDAVETLSLHRDVIQTLRSQHPSIDQVLLSASLYQVRRLTTALTEALYLPVPRRLARTLHRLLDVFPEGVIPLTQDDVAGLCGTTRQTANEVLQALVADGAITLSRGRITVIDAARLEKAAR